MTPDQQALLNAIIANPDDDLPRLVYADWLEERGGGERAEFIRYQCRDPDLAVGEHERMIDLGHAGRVSWFGIPEDWGFSVISNVLNETRPSAVVSRGFVHAVHVPTLGVWRGGECERCRNWMEGGCPTCHGTGRVPGIGRELCRWNPVQEVRVGDWGEPWAFDSWLWNADKVHEGNEDPRCDVPGPLFEIMERLGGYETCNPGRWLNYRNDADAIAALSRALILEARQPQEAS